MSSISQNTWSEWKAIKDSIDAKNRAISPTIILDNNTEASLLDSLIGLGVKQWNLTEEEIIENMDRISWHESKNNPHQQSIIGYDDNKNPIYGKDMGLFQYGKGEGNAAWTATNRLNTILKDRGYAVPSWLNDLVKNNWDMSKLTAEQQKVLFMADKLKREGNPMEGVDEPDELLNFWLNDHWQGATLFPDKVEDRTESFKKSMINYDNIKESE